MVRHSVDDNGEDASTPYFRFVNKESSKSLENRIKDPITIGSTINPAISQPTGQTLKAISAKTITRIINKFDWWYNILKNLLKLWKEIKKNMKFRNTS